MSRWVVYVLMIAGTLQIACSSSDEASSDGAVDAAADVGMETGSSDAGPDLSPDTSDSSIPDMAPDMPVVPSGVGRSCKDDTACELGDVCLNETKDLQLPDGYCTRKCTASVECGADAICGQVVGNEICVLTCAKDEDCASGYVCDARLIDFTPSAGEKICVPGSRTANHGDTCADDSDCTPGVGVCLIDQTDGYCSAFCDPQVADSCGVGGECVPQTGLPLGGLCVRSCDKDADCRNGVGYACVNAFAGFATQGTVCAPGTQTAATGDPCTTHNDCKAGVGICLDPARTGLPGGYCSTPCDAATSPDPCGDGAECVAFPGGGLCLDSCGVADTCRDGYECVDKFENVPSSATVCASGKTDEVPIGADCSDGSDCTAGAQGCLVEALGFVPEGYCTAACATQPDIKCPDGSVCVGTQQVGTCLASCETDADCAALRSPSSTAIYGCARRFATGQLLAAGKACTAVNPDAKVGDPCTTGADCNGELGRCIFDTDPAAAVRFANGYCTLDCDPQATENSCGTNAVCHNVSKGSSLGGSCVKTCVADAECRTGEGYSCKASSAGDKACLP